MLRILCLLLLAAIATGNARAAVTEWKLVDPALEQQTTLALTRYYTDVKPKSIWVRYITQNAGRLQYRLRSSRTQVDTLGQLISLSLGQFRIFTVTEIRIALGDDLYGSLLLSRNAPGAEQETVYTGDTFSHDDWSGMYSTFLSFDRIDHHIEPDLGAFIALGAPESNLSWWNDGTFRVGLTAPEWEFALLAPLGSGAAAVGPLRERLLAPGFGAEGMARIEGFTGRIRFTGIGTAAFDSPRIAPGPYVHTLSLQGTYRMEFETSVGTARLEAGADFEEYTEAWRDSDGSPIPGERTRRFSPLSDLFWTFPGNNIRLGLGTADLALRGSATVRLTDNLWFEVRAVSNDLLHAPEPFEQPFLLFLTPRIKF
jgi:hypothetical protein